MAQYRYDPESAQVTRDGKPVATVTPEGGLMMLDGCKRFRSPAAKHCKELGVDTKPRAAAVTVSPIDASTKEVPVEEISHDELKRIRAANSAGAPSLEAENAMPNAAAPTVSDVLATPEPGQPDYSRAKAKDPGPVCPIAGKPHMGDKDPEVVHWWLTHHPAAAKEKYGEKRRLVTVVRNNETKQVMTVMPPRKIPLRKRCVMCGQLFCYAGVTVDQINDPDVLLNPPDCLGPTDCCDDCWNKKMIPRHGGADVSGPAKHLFYDKQQKPNRHRYECPGIDFTK